VSRCLVTGVAGFIGSHVADLLLAEGHEVWGIDNLSTGKLENVSEQVKFINADISQPDVYRILPEFDYVYHLAALARIQPSIEEPLPAHDTNLTGTLLLLEYCHKVGAKIIFSSSSSIYKGDDIPTKEEGHRHPKSPYGLQKWMSEEYIALWSEMFDLDYTILRYFNVYGERQILEGAYAAVVGIFLRQSTEGKELTITGDGENRRDFTYVRDVARANLMAMNWGRTAYNVGTGKNYSINEIAALVGGSSVYIPARPGEARVTLADNTKARSLGWAPTVDIRDWIAQQNEVSA
jgi:UDP-glucose 4-epimerase